MMRVIRARDAIQQINLMASAFGSLEENAAREFSRELQRESTLGGLPSSGATRPRSYEELAALMSSGPKQEIVVE